MVMKMIIKNIEKGIKEGVYRKDIDPSILARMRMEQVETVFNPQVFSPRDYHIGDVQFQIFKHFIFGLVTLKGYEMLSESLAKNDIFKR